MLSERPTSRYTLGSTSSHLLPQKRATVYDRRRGWGHGGEVSCPLGGGHHENPRWTRRAPRPRIHRRRGLQQRPTLRVADLARRGEERGGRGGRRRRQRPRPAATRNAR